MAAKAIGEFGAAKAEGGKEQVEMEGSKDKEGPMIVGGRYESENKRIEGIRELSDVIGLCRHACLLIVKVVYCQTSLRSCTQSPLLSRVTCRRPRSLTIPCISTAVQITTGCTRSSVLYPTLVAACCQDSVSRSVLFRASSTTHVRLPTHLCPQSRSLLLSWPTPPHNLSNS